MFDYLTCFYLQFCCLWGFSVCAVSVANDRPHHDDESHSSVKRKCDNEHFKSLNSNRLSEYLGSLSMKG